MHGDYQLANVMFRKGASARLAAIVDWEMGTCPVPSNVSHGGAGFTGVLHVGETAHRAGCPADVSHVAISV